jgi:hypothetical protein
MIFADCCWAEFASFQRDNLPSVLNLAHQAGRFISYGYQRIAVMTPVLRLFSAGRSPGLQSGLTLQTAPNSSMKSTVP